ncbi:unnamed protein product [Haemonchus placei]|uniref:Sushi, von Willebrand factor type A, EGF and pentraxin domain-containing protein 1 n=1 Tax=Haemonchus placei TaxID=6290 RepID=A0A0N4W1Z3_HAEPC|nr:unnamed protein product [Haemonchus placei]
MGSSELPQDCLEVTAAIDDMNNLVLVLLIRVIHLTFSQSPECPNSRAPSQLGEPNWRPSQRGRKTQVLTDFSLSEGYDDVRVAQCSESYTAVTVWTRESNGSLIYRISDEDLADEGYRRGLVDREDIVVLLARSPGAIVHQENVIGVPEGFTDIHSDFYCVRRFGDCGAERPVFRFVRGFGSSLAYAYSLDPTASFPGYTREGKILCYGWSDNGSVVHPLSAEKTCLPINAIANGRITYSSPPSTIYSIGTTATLVCDPGYLGGGQSAVLCVKTGWYPSTGLGYCVKRNDSVVNSGSATAVSSASQECAALGGIPDGQLIYSTLAIGAGQSCPEGNPVPDTVSVDEEELPRRQNRGRPGLDCWGRFLQGTHVTVVCNLGFNVFGTIDAICISGRWSRKLGICQSNFRPKCPPLDVKFPGRVIYNSLAPYMPSATATLTCDLGLSVAGVSTLTCTEDGWSPSGGFGECRTITRRKRQAQTGLNCSALDRPSSTIMYVQANTSIPYSTDTTAFLMCNIGFTSQGSTSSLCQNGIWTPPLGTCLSSSQNGSSNLVTGQQPGMNSGNAGSTCMAIAAPLNGYVNYSQNASGESFVALRLIDGDGNPGGIYPSGTVASLSCNLGYTVSGSMASTCSGGTWIPSVLGTCNPGLSGLGTVMGSSSLTCTNPPTVMNGVISYSMGTASEITKQSGTVATLTCNMGFTSTGSPTSICQNGAFTPTLGTCIPIAGGPAEVVYQCTGGVGGIVGTTSQTCPPLFPPFGGTLNYSNGSNFGPFNAGTTVTLRCNNGIPTGTSVSTCMNGQWSPPTLGTCSLDGGTGTGTGTSVTCPALVAPVGGTLSYSQGGTTGPFPSGSTVSLMCSSGFPTGICRVFLDHNVKQGGDSRADAGEGRELIVSRRGISFAFCTNGQWNPPTLGTCSTTGTGGTGNTGTGSGLTCFAMFPPFGGTLQYSTGGNTGPYPAGSTVTLMCNNGFPTGPSTASCTNGQWSPTTLGSCSTTGTGGVGGTGGIGGVGGTGGIGGQTCPPITTPIGATVSYSTGNMLGPFNSGVTATMNCMSGSPLGATSSTCSNGQWFPPSLGTCNSSMIGGAVGSSPGTTCPALAPPMGGTISFSNGSMGTPATTGTIATLTCLSGTVSATTCPAMTTPVGASLTYSNQGLFPPFPSGTTVSARCLSGSAMTGMSTSTCMNGVWTPATLGTCGTTTGGLGGTTGTGTGTCPTTQAIGGTIDYSDNDFSINHSPGSTATLLCTSGTPLGSAISTCMNGQWTPPLGSCSTAANTSTSGFVCYFPPFSPFGSTLAYSSGGNTFGPWNAGTTVTMTCPSGQTPIGSSTSTCSNGVWTTLGSCSSTGGSTFSFLSGFSCFFGLIEPLDGSITYSDPTPPYAPGSTATLICDPGFTAKGPITANCTDGSFTPIGTCSKT